MKVTGRNEQTKPRSTRTALVLVAVLILFSTVVLNSFRLPANAQEDTRAIVTISVESTQPGELIVSWEPPAETPHDYRISWAKVGEEFLTWTDSTGNAFPTSPPYTITDLDEGVSYKVILRARYGGTSGAWTEPVEAVVAAESTPTATVTHTPQPEDPLTKLLLPHGYSHRNCHTYASTRGHGYSHQNCHTYASTRGHGYSHRNCHTYASTRGHGYSHRNCHANYYGNAGKQPSRGCY